MTRNGVNCLVLKPQQAVKRGSVMRVHNHQALTRLKPPLVKRSKQPFVPRVIRHQNAMVRRRWQMVRR